MLKYWTDDDPTVRDFPSPTELSWELNDVDKTSGRNDHAVMLREVVGKKNKITIKWAFAIETPEFRRFVKWAKGLPPFFYVQFYDPAGDPVTMEAYSSKLAASLAYEDSQGRAWKNFSFSAIER